jgi:hypothetical protein
MTRAHRGALVLALLCGLAVIGCGESNRPLKPLGRAQLIAKAEPICRTVVDTIDYSALTQAKIVSLASRLAAVEEHAAQELAKLIPPPSMFAEWQVIVDGFRQSAEQFRLLGRTATANSQGGMFETLYGVSRQRAVSARAAGFKVCGTY